MAKKENKLCLTPIRPPDVKGNKYPMTVIPAEAGITVLFSAIQKHHPDLVSN